MLLFCKSAGMQFVNDMQTGRFPLCLFRKLQAAADVRFPTMSIPLTCWFLPKTTCLLLSSFYVYLVVGFSFIYQYVCFYLTVSSLYSRHHFGSSDDLHFYFFPPVSSRLFRRQAKKVRVWSSHLNNLRSLLISFFGYVSLLH